MAIRGILFDKDGTVIDYWRTWVPINREVALYAARGDTRLPTSCCGWAGTIPPPTASRPARRWRRAISWTSPRPLPRIRKSRRPASWSAGIERIFCSGGAQHSALIDGARDTLVELKRSGFRIGLATNDSAGGLEASLAQHDVLASFRFRRGVRFRARLQARPAHGARLLRGRRRSVATRSPWSAMRCTTSPWAARRGWP